MITKPVPTAAIIVIGNEILSGRTQDQNISYIAKKLHLLGIILKQVHIIPDIEESIVEYIQHCHKNYTYVFTTGGIGPTHDDITAMAVAKAFNTPLELNTKALDLLESHYGKDKLNQARTRMAMIPKGASLILNPVSAAPGFQVQNVFVMAGVPEIMQAMFDGISNRLLEGPKIYSKTVQCLLTESTLAEDLRDIQRQFEGVEIGSYPFFKHLMFGVSLVLKGTDEAKVHQATQTIVNLIIAKGGEPTLCD